MKSAHRDSSKAMRDNRVRPQTPMWPARCSVSFADLRLDRPRVLKPGRVEGMQQPMNAYECQNNSTFRAVNCSGGHRPPRILARGGVERGRSCDCGTRIYGCE